jgi:dipeptidyl aminopeptidase/acylaminoacyl peptidase
MTGLRLKDFYRMKYLSDVRCSGSRILFVVTKPDERKNDYESRIWLFDGKLKHFTGGPKDSSPRWSKDGKSIAFVSERGREKTSGIYIISSDGGEAENICEFEGKISSPAWSVDGDRIFFIGTGEQKTEGKKKSDVKVARKFPFYFNGKGFLDGKETHLYSTSLKGKVVQITRGPLTVNQFDVSPTASRIALAIRKDEWDVYTTDLFTCDADGKGLKSITGKPAGYSYPVFSPDGKQIAFLYRDVKNGRFQHNRICTISSGGKGMRQISDLDRNPGNSVNSDSRTATDVLLKWSYDGRRLYFTATDRGRCSIYVTDTVEGKTRKAYDFEGSVESFDFLGDGFAVIAQDSSLPTELYTFEDGKTVRLTKMNREIEARKLRKAEHFSFNSADGVPIDGWYLSYGERKKPGILEIHGGPKTAYGNAFMFEFQLLASAGYAVIYFNPRGSDGYENTFSQAVREDFGGWDYQDLMKGVEFALQKYRNIDGARLGVTGGSYGGFMTNWIIGHTSLFKAAVTQRSISNQISFFGTSDIGPWFNGDQIGGTPWNNIETYWDKSPLKFAENVNTPLLIIHSEEDYRCPVEQAYQFYSALKFFGKEVEMKLFPGENHELSRSGKPVHRVERLKCITEWFDRYLKG